MTARRFIPEDGQHLAGKLPGSWEAWFYTTVAGAPALVFYAGKSCKPTAHNRFSATAEGLAGRLRYLQRLASTADDAARRELERRAELEKPHGLTVGTVLVHSWGYDQTNIDYFQVTATAGRRTVEVRPIAQEKTPSGDMQGYCVPCPGQFTGAAFRAKVSACNGVRVPGHERGYATPLEIVGAVPGGAPVYRRHSWTSYA